MADAFAGMKAELAAMEIARRHFPIWTDWGVEDESLAVHSLGLSYLLTVGQSLGFVGCCEYPVAGHHVRADGVWWDTTTRQPVAVFEFERHKGGGELVAKVHNLMRAWHACAQEPSLLALVFWSRDFYPSTEEVVRPLWREMARGFTDDEGAKVAPVPVGLLRIFECLHLRGTGGRIILKGFHEWRRA